PPFHDRYRDGIQQATATGHRGRDRRRSPRGHFRTETGEEVDLVLERNDGQVIAVEIKAGSRISGEDFRGLRQLKERLGPRLEEGVVLHTGEHAYTHDDWVTVLPLAQIWASVK